MSKNFNNNITVNSLFTYVAPQEQLFKKALKKTQIESLKCKVTAFRWDAVAVDEKENALYDKVAFLIKRGGIDLLNLRMLLTIVGGVQFKNLTLRKEVLDKKGGALSSIKVAENAITRYLDMIGATSPIINIELELEDAAEVFFDKSVKEVLDFVKAKWPKYFSKEEYTETRASIATFPRRCLQALKEAILVDGFKYDGMSYRWAVVTASDGRKAVIEAIPAFSYKEVAELWCHLCGLEKVEELNKLFGKEINGIIKVPYAKLTARLGMRGSGSLDINAILESGGKTEALEKIQGLRVLEIKDSELVEDRIFSTTTIIDHKLVVKNMKHKVQLMDGMCFVRQSLTVLLAEIIGLSYTPGAFQFRHGGDKGLMLAVPDRIFDKTVKTKRHDIIMPESVRKFSKRNVWSDFPLEIMSWSKPRYEKDLRYSTTTLNTQTLGALNVTDISLFKERIETIHTMCMEALSGKGGQPSPEKIMALLNMVSSEKSGDAEVSGEIVKDALESNRYLVGEHRVSDKIKEAIDNIYIGLKYGRIPVTGAFLYMAQDPMYLWNKLFGTHYRTLKSGECYISGFEGDVALFRVPMAHESQVLKQHAVKGIYNPNLYAGIVILNAQDSGELRMSDADYDGDGSAAIPKNGEAINNFIVDSVSDKARLIYSGKLNPEMGVLDYKEMSKYLVRTLKRDRTGTVTNFISSWTEVKHHMSAVIELMRKEGCKKALFKEGQKEVVVKDGVLIVPGVVSYTKDIMSGKYVQDLDIFHLLGEYGITELKKQIKFCDNMTKKGAVLQSWEIDGAKNGGGAEGPNVDDEHPVGDYTPDFKVRFRSEAFVARTFDIKGKEASKLTELSQYRSLSPFGQLFELGEAKHQEVRELFKAMKSDRRLLLLSIVERTAGADLYKLLETKTAKGSTLLERIHSGKEFYSAQVKSIMENSGLTDKEQRRNIAVLKERVADILRDEFNAVGVPEYALATACYIVANESYGAGKSFGWLFNEKLLQIFRSSGQGIKVYPIKKTEDNEAKIFDFNGKSYGVVTTSQDYTKPTSRVYSGSVAFTCYGADKFNTTANEVLASINDGQKVALALVGGRVLVYINNKAVGFVGIMNKTTVYQQQMLAQLASTRKYFIPTGYISKTGKSLVLKVTT